MIKKNIGFCTPPYVRGLVVGWHILCFLLSVLICVEVFALAENVRILGAAVEPQQDLSRMAEDAFAEGEKLRRQDTREALSKAIEKYEEASTLWERTGEKKRQAQALYSIGKVYYLMREHQRALDLYGRALTVFQSLTVNGEEAEQIAQEKAGLLLNIGITHLAIGENDAALNFYDLALQSFRGLNDLRGEAFTIREKGRTHYLLGENQVALNHYSEAMLIWQKIEDSREIAFTKDLIGRSYFSLGDDAEAFRYFEEALTLQQNLKNKEPRREAQIITDLGRVNFITGKGEEALRSFEQARSMFHNSGDLLGEAEALAYIGTVLLSFNQYEEAQRNFEEALKYQRQIGDRRGEGETLHRMGQALYKSGDKQRSLARLREALELWLQTRYKLGEANTRFMISRIGNDLGMFDEAREQIEAAIKIIESQRAEVISPELRTTYFVSEREYYELYVDLLMRLHRQAPARGYDALALNVSERARARTLLELLEEAHVRLSSDIPPALLERQQKLRRLLNSEAGPQIQLLRNKLPADRETEVKRRLDEVEREYEQVETSIRSLSPRYVGLRHPHILTVPEIQKQLDPDTLLLEYILGDERSYLWVVSPDHLLAVDLPPRAEIEALAEQFRSLVTRREDVDGGEAQLDRVATRLSHLLLGKVAALLGKKRLVIVREGVLQYVAFAALREPEVTDKPIAGKRQQIRELGTNFVPLILNHEIVYEPSFSTLALTRQDQRKAPPGGAVAVIANPVFSPDDDRVGARTRNPGESIALRNGADKKDSLARTAACQVGFCDLIPPLMFSGEEAQKIYNLARANGGGKLAENFEANKETATDPELARRFRTIHFSTHALINNEHPELSGIVLSLVDEQGKPREGFLQLYEIYDLRMPVELVVLSACQTALGKDARGEGLIGLTRGFMYAGAPRVAATLWEVDDRATAELMVRFYEKMLGREKLTPASAMRAAQVSLWRENSRLSKPFYWAGFILEGEWRAIQAPSR